MYQSSVSRRMCRLALATYFGVNAFFIDLSPPGLSRPAESRINRDPTTEELRNTPVKDLPDYLKIFTIQPGQRLPE